MIAQFVIVFYFISVWGLFCLTASQSNFKISFLCSEKEGTTILRRIQTVFLENITENKKQEKRLVKELQSTVDF